MNTETSNTDTQSDTGKRLTRVEWARLEALQTFGGSGFDVILSESKRKIARTLEVRGKEDEGTDSKEKENTQAVQ